MRTATALNVRPEIQNDLRADIESAPESRLPAQTRRAPRLQLASELPASASDLPLPCSASYEPAPVNWELARSWGRQKR